MKTAKTRFLQNPHPPDLHIGVRDWLTQQDALGHHVYCLIDGALVGERSLRKLTRAGITWLSPVANNHPEAHEGLGLLLFDLQGPARQIALPLILEITNGVPTLQFISLHSEQRDHLPRLLAWLSEIHMGKGQAFYGRLADNRILSPMLSILSPLQNQVLGETIALWAWLDRTGRLEERTFPHVDRVPDILLDNGELLPFVLSDWQHADLMRLTAIDMHYAKLLEKVPEILPATHGAALHERLDRINRRALARGIQDEMEQLLFLTVALTCSDDFDDAPFLTQDWEKVAKGAAFSSLVRDWDDEIWLRLTPMAVKVAH
ncbi:hypothetical protein [Oryzomicrobium sp.]|uniref:hypothetical protein n=1 Tax=Oryzomicrobium sp. TaxID=1911578 RepID=UPI002FE238F1